MKNSYQLTKVALIFLCFLCISTCFNSDRHTVEDIRGMTEVYKVLEEKTLTVQADFDMEAWSEMLADDVSYSFPDSGANEQTTLYGKPAVMDYWQNWRKKHSIKSMSFSGFTHAPFISDQNLNVSGLSGVYVFSIFTSKMIFTNGETVEIFMNYCCHFNKDKRIDRCYTYYDRTPIIQALTRGSTH